MATAADNDGERSFHSQYSVQLKEGDSSLARADLDSAEQHFAAALKAVHVRDPTAQQYQREVEPLCKLGDVYSKRGQQTGDGGDFVKAAALYNAAIARSKDEELNGNIETNIREVERSFLKYILCTNCNVSQDDTEKHKKQLKKMRDQIKLEMETIDQQLDPYVHDEDDPCVRDIEAKRAQAVRKLFEKIAQQRKEFIFLLLNECIELMGPPPCKYALIGLGSQATGLVTPYSDLEFAILVQEEREEFRVYFRNLTHYLHLKVVNLGETILPALGIKSLNDFYSEDPLDNWYYDSVTPRGFAFDGSMPKASKTPLGRQGTVDEPPSELICTPKRLVLLLQKDATLYFKEGYHLATILINPCLIAGDQDLVDTYIHSIVKMLQGDRGEMARNLALRTLKDNIVSDIDEEIIKTTLIDVKKEIYRFPAVAVDCMALSSGIIPNTVWQTIEEMETQQVISRNIAHRLTVLTSISAELRLRTYIANGGQRENISALASMESARRGQESFFQNVSLQHVFHIPNERQLFRYYFTASPLRRLLYYVLGYYYVRQDDPQDHKKQLKEMQDHVKQEVETTDQQPDLYDDSSYVRGMMYFQLCRYSLATSCFKEALKKAKDEKQKAFMLSHIGNSYRAMGEYQQAIKYTEEALQVLCGTIITRTTGRPSIEYLLSMLGEFVDQLANNRDKNSRKAASYVEQALQTARSMLGQDTAHPLIATLLANLGHVRGKLGDHQTAVDYIEQGLQMFRTIYGANTDHPAIANSLLNLGQVWDRRGDHRVAINYLEQALQMERAIFGEKTAHPSIICSLNSLGSCWLCLNEYGTGIDYFQQALQMCKDVYGPTTAHPHTALLLKNLGIAWNRQGVHTSGSFYGRVLQVFGRFDGPNLTSSDKSLHKLASSRHHLGYYRKAHRYYKEALQMYKSLHGQSPAYQSDIAFVLHKLGDICCHLGDLRKAVHCYKETLKLHKSLYGENTAHPDSVGLLNDLGKVQCFLGEHITSLNTLTDAFHMAEQIESRDKSRELIKKTEDNIDKVISMKLLTGTILSPPCTVQ
uniref:Protein-PII uridylyltransferase N-terminal domain-containing protein n=1 Tax=Branchiostoma floridae TaxID=7739 RepID=C3ZJ00_BRAFL|eukprot:XP_002591505.1 hypothetical protein BRAFLDRAFT_105271 [Branchiostoma floridae]